MSEQVGQIHYDVTLETAGLVEGQRRVERAAAKATDSLDAVGAAADKAGQRFTDASGRLREANGQFVKTGSAAQTAASSFKGASSEADGLNTRLNALTIAVKVLAAAYAVMKAAQLADDIRLMAARVDVAAESTEAGGAAMARLVSISRDTQTAVSANVEVFTRLNQSLLQMGGTQNDTLRITELLGKAIKVSGASAVEAKAAMLQFGQALGSGKLQGDELKSLMETAPYLMKKLADGIGVPVGALKKLGEEGKLTADVVVNALSKAATKIEADFEKFPQTVAGAMQVASDAAGRANEKFDTLTGSSAALTGIAKGTGEVFDELATQFESATTESDKLGRNDSIKSWATTAKTFLSYVVDAADLTWQTLSVLGRNVAFVFQSIGAEIGGIGAQVKAVMSGDLAGAMAIREAMVSDSKARRTALDAADAKTLSGAKLAGQKMREAWEAGAGKPKAVVTETTSTLRAPKADASEAAKMAAKAEAAKAYYEGLVAENAVALDKIDAQERKALAENAKRAATDKDNAEVYAKAKVEIHKKYARERAVFEEKNLQGIADLAIATTIDETQKVELIRAEAMRRADAAERTGASTREEAERARTLATFQAEKSRTEITERNNQARAEAAILLTQSEEQRILLIRNEAIRQAEAAYQRGATTFEEAEAKKVAAVMASRAQQKSLESTRASTEISTLQLRSESGGVEAKVALIQAQAAAELAANEAARAVDLEANQIYADKKVAIEEDMNRRVAETRAAANQAALTSTSDAFGAIVNVLKRADGEQSGIYQAMFAAQKAFAIASAIVNIQTALASAAASLPFPGNLGVMAAVAASTASIIGTITGTTYGGARQYGGPTQAGSLYRVNETGAPEMFTASNGNQFMLGGSSGNVTPADQVGGGGLVYSPTINIDGTADRAAITVQVQRAIANSQKDFMEQMKRMKVIPQ